MTVGCAAGTGRGRQYIGPLGVAIGKSRNDFRFRVGEYLAGVSVDGQHSTDLDVERSGTVNDGGDAHLSGENRGVAVATARLGDDAGDERLVEHGGVGRSQIQGDDDRALGQRRNARRR